MRIFSVLRQAEKVLVRAASGNPTGLAGIHQHPNPRPALIKLYQIQLSKLQEKIPEHAVYRQAVEAFTSERLKIAEENEVIEDIEAKIGGGLIEELLIQANDELDLTDKMAEWKAWEDLQEKPLDDQWTYFGKKI